MDFLINYTFIIPHYNIPLLLKRCLASIPRRNDIQIIIVDDNSDSGKVDFANFPGLGEQCVEVYFTKEGKGAGYARNIGLKHAKGKWLLFADSDDFYNEGFLEILDKYRQDDFDILFFSANSVDSNTLLPARRVPGIEKYCEMYDKVDLRSADFIKYKLQAPWNKMFMRGFIEKYNIVFDEIVKGNDITFSFCASYLCRSFMVDISRLYCVTYRADSMTFAKRPVESYYCDITNQFRINAFFRYIGRKEWARPVFINEYMRIFYKRGFFFFLDICMYTFRRRKKLRVEKNHIIREVEKRKK